MLNVAVVPAMDSAGFFIAMHDGLFAREGLTIKYTPAISSETAVAEQLKGQLDISGGNYVSYINEAAQNHQPIEVVAEGSIMQQGAQTIFTMPNSKIKTIAQLKGHLIGVNAPGNIDYLLGVSVLSENGLDPKSVQFPNATMKAFSATGGAIPFPFMAADLASGKISAAIMPEPFATQAEQEYGAVPLADLNQGATSDFPIEGYVATKAWAAKYPNTLKRFLAALETGQEIADTDRSAVEHGVRIDRQAAGRPGAEGHRRGHGARHLPDRRRRDPAPARRERHVPVRSAAVDVRRVEHAAAEVVLQLLPVLFGQHPEPGKVREVSTSRTRL